MISFLLFNAGFLNLLFYIFAIGFLISLGLEQWLKFRPLSVDASMNERNMYIVQSNRRYCWRQAWMTNVYMKIDTQGMSYGDGKGDGRTLEEQRAAIPPFNPPKLNIISDALKIELKDLINEVLDEREHEKKLNGPYDVYEDESDEWLYRGTY